jgi:hypothetical protein
MRSDVYASLDDEINKAVIDYIVNIAREFMRSWSIRDEKVWQQ